MSDVTLSCRSEQRRHAVRRAKGLNGLDYVEVDGPSLTVFFLGKAPAHVDLAEIRIGGGRRIRSIRPTHITIQRQEDPDLDDCMTITVDQEGDFSTYTLCLIEVDENGRPTGRFRPDFDPRYACLDFTFRVDCPSDLDCKTEMVCPPPEWDEPEISYLAKDYASFRRLILDRLSLIMPDWRELHVPDIGITLVEILAYVGDYLSYYQDAVATEAYLSTARQRISVRRHARLVDYQMHEGCNARAFVHVATKQGDSELPTDSIAFITNLEAFQIEPGRLLSWSDLADISLSHYQVFAPLVAEPGQKIRLYQAHNEVYFYTWGDEECCLPRGATSATLIDGPLPAPPDIAAGEEEWQTAVQQVPLPKAPEEPSPSPRALHLEVGDLVLFEEVIGPKTGQPADADPSHRHVVRLTKVVEDVDPLTGQPVREIEWDEADALPFPLCISVVGPPPDCKLLPTVSVARGNMLLVDHGRFIVEPEDEPWQVPTAATEVSCEGRERPSEVKHLPGPFRPVLAHKPITFSQPYPAGQPAAHALVQEPRQATPWIKMISQGPAGQDIVGRDVPPLTWESQRDLLASGPRDPHFVAEIDNDCRAHLRFGDGELGQQPAAGATFTACYRIGRGQVGNVGADAIRHILLDEGVKIEGVDWRPRNPLPAQGGTDPEPMDAARRYAPAAFRHRLKRAVIAADYAAIVVRDFAHKVQRATAKLRWNGSWYEVLVAIDPMGGGPADPELLQAITEHLYRYRRIGHDLIVREARYVPLDVALQVCVRPGFLRGHVKAALKQLFSNRRLPDGRLGFFHPDNLSFGDEIHVSRLLAAAQTVQGVESVTVARLERLYEGPNREIERGILPLGPLEIARLDNDPSLPENGRLELIMEGGR